MAGISKRKETIGFTPSFKVCGTHNHLDAFPLLIVIGLKHYTLWYNIIVYALSGLMCIISTHYICCYISVAVCSHSCALNFLTTNINKPTNELRM